MIFSKIKRLVVGAPLSTSRFHEEKISKLKALAVLSSDALSSTAYATEEILLVLLAMGSLALNYSLPIALAIVTLLFIVAASYRQTIQYYRNGGGAYLVAKENLGILPALVAASALIIDYILTVAVSTAAGVYAVVSAFPSLHEHKILIGIFLIFVLTVLNLRGLKESATIFALPTYIFMIFGFILIVAGGYQYLQGHVVQAIPISSDLYPAVPIFLILKAFSSGCAALTGVEAISNAVPIFQEPAHKNAKTTMTWMALILGFLFIGITSVALAYGIQPLPNETVVSQVARSVFGTGFIYYVMQISTALILMLAANTAYNGLPWMTSILANDRYFPRQFAVLGDRLVYSNTIFMLSIAASLLLILFHGETHALIPLYSVGVFLSFTLAQTGMVRHHLKHKQEGWSTAIWINGLGAVATGVVTLVVAVSKFSHGAWMVLVLIPTFVFIFTRINRHYLAIGRELNLANETAPIQLTPIKHTVIVPISGIHRGVVQSLQYALSISNDVRAVYIEIDPSATERIKKEWDRWGHQIPFVILKSPFRSIIRPILEYIEDVDRSTNGDVITVIVPEFVTRKWWHSILHNQTALVIRTALMFQPRRVVISVRYHLKST